MTVARALASPITVGAPILTRSPAETHRVGRRFAREVRAGDTVAVCGGLGSGKTRFIQGLCRGLGCAVPATSPSFVSLHRYPVRNSSGAGIKFVYHGDFYLLPSPAAAVDLGLDELFGASDAVVVVEWAQRFPEVLPADCWWVQIEWTPEASSHRVVVIQRRVAALKSG